jgi:hypothetical protein
MTKYAFIIVILKKNFIFLPKFTIQLIIKLIYFLHYLYSYTKFKYPMFEHLSKFLKFLNRV